MTEINFSKMKNHPLNRDGETITVTADEGDLVGLAENSGETELVVADADSASPQPAVGVLLEEVQDPSNINVSGFDDAYIEQRQLRRQVREDDGYTLVGDEATYVTHGVYLSNVDEDTDWTPGDAVYLAVGGGFTQSPQADDGDIIQKVGFAVDADTFYLDVEQEYQVGGSATFSGDSSQTAFDVAHGLDSAPDPADVEITPTSGDGAGDFYISTGATNVTVNYVSAPASGTDNVQFDYVIDA